MNSTQIHDGQAKQIDMEKETLARAYYEPFNTGDLSIYEAILAEDWVETPLTIPGQQPGRAGFLPVVTMFRQIFPDLHITNEDAIVSGDKVTVRSTVRGTQQGELFGLPATGRPVAVMAIDIHRIENGKIVETWHVEELLNVVFQIGASLQPGAAATETAS